MVYHGCKKQKLSYFKYWRMVACDKLVERCSIGEGTQPPYMHDQVCYKCYTAKAMRHPGKHSSAYAVALKTTVLRSGRLSRLINGVNSHKIGENNAISVRR